MKNHFKYSILTILTLITIVGLVFAQPVPIGADRQPVPFESNPSSYTVLNMGTVSTPTNMWDGDLASYCEFSIGSGFGTSGNLVVKGFDVPSNPFAIEWVDLKIKYQVPLATTDDSYRIEYLTSGSVWTILEPNTGVAFDVGGNPPPPRPWSQIQPTGGVTSWSWAELSKLQIRVWATRAGTGWDNRKMRIVEAWLTVYPEPLPPTSSPTVSIQPMNTTTGPCGGFVPNYFFVDVYVMDMVNMLGYELVINFDPGVILGVQALNYYPFKSEVFPPVIDNVAGYVSIAYYTFGGDPDGLTGNGPVARIYFQVGDVGLPPTSDFSPISLGVSKISDTLGGRIEHTTHDGAFEVAHYWSATDAALVPITINPADPIGTHWHEIYPTYSEEFDITSWTDTGGDGVLSASDKIDVERVSTGLTEWYHIDEVTITIWWTIKAGDPYGWDGMESLSEPELPASELITDPIGSKWHQIYPPDFYSLTFTITSWDDDGDGYFDPSDQFDFEYDFDPGVTHWAHLDSISTDIIVTPTEPDTPEFPLGIGVLFSIVGAIPIIYVWRTRPKKKVE